MKYSDKPKCFPRDKIVLYAHFIFWVAHQHYCIIHSFTRVQICVWKYFAGDLIKCILLIERFRILIQILLNCVPRGPTYNKPALVHVTARCQTGDKSLYGAKSLPKPMATHSLLHICVTEGQWVNYLTNFDEDDHLATLISQDPKVKYQNHAFTSHVKFQDKYLYVCLIRHCQLASMTCNVLPMIMTTVVSWDKFPRVTLSDLYVINQKAIDQAIRNKISHDD